MRFLGLTSFSTISIIIFLWIDWKNPQKCNFENEKIHKGKIDK